jgi:hypothetical protein
MFDNQVYSVRCYSEAGAVEVSCEQVSEIGFHKMRGVPVCIGVVCTIRLAECLFIMP